jgi:hypothetical protein
MSFLLSKYYIADNQFGIRYFFAFLLEPEGSEKLKIKKQ